MKYLLILLMICGVAYAQEPPYTPMKGNYKFKGIKVDSLFLIPSFADTTAANGTFLDSVAGAMIRTGNDFWMRNSELTSWLQNINIGSGSSPVGLSLQNVLDNNHDLVNGNNFQGTGAGIGNTSTGVIAFGDSAGVRNSNSGNIFMGLWAGKDNSGSLNIGLGEACLYGNSGNYVVGIGAGALAGNAYDYVTGFGRNVSATNSKQLIFTDDDHSVRINWEPISDDRTFTLPPQADGTFKVTNYYAPDLTSADYYAFYPGVYFLNNGNSYDFIFPDCTLMVGQTIILWNRSSGGDINLIGTSCTITNPDNSGVSIIPTSTSYTFVATPVTWLKTN